MTCDAKWIWKRFWFSSTLWIRVAGTNKAQISIDKRHFRKIIIRFPIMTVLKEYRMNLELIFIFNGKPIRRLQ